MYYARVSEKPTQIIFDIMTESAVFSIGNIIKQSKISFGIRMRNHFFKTLFYNFTTLHFLQYFLYVITIEGNIIF